MEEPCMCLLPLVRGLGQQQSVVEWPPTSDSGPTLTRPQPQDPAQDSSGWACACGKGWQQGVGSQYGLPTPFHSVV